MTLVRTMSFPKWVAASAQKLFWPKCCWKIQTWSCFTNQPTIWTPRTLNGWLNIWMILTAQPWLFHMTTIFWNAWPTRSVTWHLARSPSTAAALSRQCGKRPSARRPRSANTKSSRKSLKRQSGLFAKTRRVPNQPWPNPVKRCWPGWSGLIRQLII